MFGVIFAGQTAWIMQTSKAANSKLIIFLTTYDYMSVRQELLVDHAGTTESEVVRHTNRSCCFASPTQSTNHGGVSLGCHHGRKDFTSKANHGGQVLASLKVKAHEHGDPLPIGRCRHPLY